MSAEFTIDPAKVQEWKRYPEYKDSGVEWLGEVPAGWGILRLKQATQKMIGGATPASGNPVYYSNSEGAIPWVTIADISKCKLVTATASYITEEGLKSKNMTILPQGTLLYSIYASLGKVAVLGVPATTNQAILGIVPIGEILTSEYLFYLLRYMEQYVPLLSSSNTQNNLNAEKVRNMPIFAPSISEQHTIAAFLDREIARIDALIEKKQRFIELLEEKRQALITQAVTKGLDPDVEMKDSGVEWLGEIPKHWDVRRGRFLYRQLELSPNSNDGVVTAFRDGQVISREKRRTDGFTIAIKEVGYQGVRKGDLVIHSMDGFAGAIGVSESDGKCTGEYVVCDPIQRCNNHYFAACLRLMALRGYIHALCPSVRQRAPRFRFVRFKDVLLPTPPYLEQNEIISYITESTKDLGELIEKNLKIIRILLEYRAALISAAVTGKIDVRGEVPAAP